jgi:hypothetical protein
MEQVKSKKSKVKKFNVRAQRFKGSRSMVQGFSWQLAVGKKKQKFKSSMLRVQEFNVSVGSRQLAKKRKK